jgi:hypothetical protein
MVMPMSTTALHGVSSWSCVSLDVCIEGTRGENEVTLCIYLVLGVVVALLLVFVIGLVVGLMLGFVVGLVDGVVVG